MTRLIDADALKKAFEDIVCIEPMPYAFVKQIIDNEPTAPLPDFKEGYKQAILDGKTNFQRQQGEWKQNFGDGFKYGYECSICKNHEWERGNFCSNCGADMRGDDNDKTN